MPFGDETTELAEKYKTIQRRPAHIEQAVQAAVDDQMLQITAPNLSNCNLNLIFVSDTEVTSVCVSWSLDDTVLKH